MPLSDDIRTLADQVLNRVDEAREFYVHSRQAWRLVQQLARKGRPVGIVNLATKRHLPTGDLESRAQRYVTVRLAESTFRDLSSVLEDWILGLIRLWLTAYPEDLDLKFDPATGQRRGKKQEEVQIPLSRLLPRRWPVQRQGLRPVRNRLDVSTLVVAVGSPPLHDETDLGFLAHT